MDTHYIVGIDAGGSHTRLRFATPEGATTHEHVHPAGDWTNLTPSGKAAVLGAHLRAVTRQPPLALGVGAHGCDSDAECEALRHAVQEETGAPTTVVNDAFLLEAAVPGGPCAGLVVGTGSIAVARTPEGASLYAGGWGWLVGDPGSAWGTVREAVRHLVTEHDRAGRDQDPLLAPLLARAGGRALRDVVGAMQRLPPREWAGWAPDVFDAAEAGSPAALAAVLSGADQLVGLVCDLAARGATVTRVVAGGSVIAARPLMADRVADGLHRGLGAPLTVFSGAPVAGAVHLARGLVAQR
ncbi:N-acetylglucosamine kinase [Streptomyces tsukubensis]|uniref:ATPase n=1 Tax=Streptomyces tsukubensis TaxID=83656 RepID=A0A1V4AGH4_9ACTN|nr:ATPase [Streptomyces tsukubensis]OON82711.1 ATPase [Streptomyces tsukubensis]QFR92114.1 ATPase [Streptomyces tsukubensis]